MICRFCPIWAYLSSYTKVLAMAKKVLFHVINCGARNQRSVILETHSELE